MKKLKIVDVEVIDIRVPTSDTLQGSDPFHKKPNWSCVYTSIKLDNGIEGLSVCFTSGAGNDWIAYGVRDIAKLFKDFDEKSERIHSMNQLLKYVTFITNLSKMELKVYQHLA